jgi:hypothetical protein
LNIPPTGDKQNLAAINSPYMTRYSKASEHGFSSDHRDQLVAKLMAEKSVAIKKRHGAGNSPCRSQHASVRDTGRTARAKKS